MVETELPEQGVVFWPVGTGDSTTIVLGDLVVQVDLHDTKAADKEGAVVAAVVDRLEDTLPKPDGTTPYLAVFALTHADLDHCRGFGDLLDSSVMIGEIWATPRLWREIVDETNMCDDARLFHEEVERRVAATLSAVKNGTQPASGDRVRIRRLRRRPRPALLRQASRHLPRFPGSDDHHPGQPGRLRYVRGVRPRPIQGRL